jgi:hypothetical protein
MMVLVCHLKKAGEADFDLFAILCSREETALEAIV